MYIDHANGGYIYLVPCILIRLTNDNKWSEYEKKKIKNIDCKELGKRLRIIKINSDRGWMVTYKD